MSLRSGEEALAALATYRLYCSCTQASLAQLPALSTVCEICLKHARRRWVTCCGRYQSGGEQKMNDAPCRVCACLSSCPQVAYKLLRSIGTRPRKATSAISRRSNADDLAAQCRKYCFSTWLSLQLIAHTAARRRCYSLAVMYDAVLRQSSSPITI